MHVFGRGREQCGGVLQSMSADIGIEVTGEEENRQSACRRQTPSTNQRAPKLRIYGVSPPFCASGLTSVPQLQSRVTDGRSCDLLLRPPPHGVDATRFGGGLTAATACRRP
jgi:hypothetical protein